VRTVDVPDINAPATVELLRTVSSSCGVLSGTSVVRSPILERFPTWLNIHCGITPRYRGVHGAFWAVYEGRPDLAGVTVHQVDAGIDTGAIVAQELIEVGSADTYRTLPVKQYLAGAPLMVAAVRAALDGSLRTYRRPELESRLWSSPGVLEYMRFRRRLASLARN
jgi:methionyl-tRNA formyltransferase